MPTKILVVDDEPDVETMILSVFRKTINSGELEFFFAGNGEEALSILEKEPSIGVILTDLNMPVMDGLTLLSKLLDLGRAYKAVVVTAYEDMSNIRAAMKYGASDFITKPIDFVDFVETLNTLIEEHKKSISDEELRMNRFVKEMLSFSHQESKTIEKVDINAVIEQAVNMAYISYQKKNPSFNMTIKTSYDDKIPKLSAYKDDLLCIFSNLVDNACYTLSEKLKKSPEGFTPTLEIITENEADRIKITLRDNGIGIAEESIDQIFNPFFTSKSTRGGTGLGLSVAYLVITKEHGGSIRVHSEPNIKTEFVITLPFTPASSLTEV